jgi:hypothetical protein
VGFKKHDAVLVERCQAFIMRADALLALERERWELNSWTRGMKSMIKQRLCRAIGMEHEYTKAQRNYDTEWIVREGRPGSETDVGL